MTVPVEEQRKPRSNPRPETGPSPHEKSEQRREAPASKQAEQKREAPPGEKTKQRREVPPAEKRRRQPGSDKDSPLRKAARDLKGAKGTEGRGGDG